MGRKPNQLILEFFIRGPKLEDASNRYQHTCKACGEKFPKGRTDTLTSHLTKKCPAISLRDRQRALLQLHDLPEFDANAGSENNGNTTLAKGKSVELPYAGNQAWSALETLAEVARQNNMGGQDGAKGKARGKASNQNTQGTDPNIDPALREAGSTPSKPQDATGVQDHGDAPAMNGLPNFHHFGVLPDSPTVSPHLPSLALLAENTVAASQVTTPSEHQGNIQRQALEPEMGVLNSGVNANVPTSVPLVQDLRAAASWPASQPSGSDAAFLENFQESLEMAARAATFGRPIAMNPNGVANREFGSPDFGNSAKVSKPKTRCRFTAVRRKEVQEVRKRGACLRCRMLKKSCSGDNPCSTCVSVESARLWKQPCIRTRIADELELYAAGLHQLLSHTEVSQAKSHCHVQFQKMSGRIEATHYYDSMVVISLSALQGPKPFTLINSDTCTSPELRLLDIDLDDLPGKMEQYLKKMTGTFLELEPSPFMKPTLQLASTLSMQKNNQLLARVVELWSATHILVDSEMSWKTFTSPSPAAAAITTIPASSPSSRVPIDELSDPESYALICSQLQAAAEKRAHHLGKLVMNDLERSLLQRQQQGWFETFLVACILLNCVERMSWLFYYWNSEDLKAKWPLEKQPSYYFNQGERFADLLHMLLRMRGLPPKVYSAAGQSVLVPPPEDTDQTVRTWFEQIALTKAQLEERQLAPFDPQNPRCWELRFGSKLLMPSGSGAGA